MNRLRVRANILCNTCRCQLVRQKTFKTELSNIEEAQAEFQQKTDNWIHSLSKQNCKTCDQIIHDHKEYSAGVDNQKVIKTINKGIDSAENA